MPVVFSSTLGSRVWLTEDSTPAARIFVATGFFDDRPCSRLSKKINSPWLAALLGLVLIGVAIYGLVEHDMATILAIIVIAVGVMNLLRLVPHPKETAQSST